MSKRVERSDRARRRAEPADNGPKRVLALRALTVLDPEGAVVKIADILDRGPTVLVFIRHFG